MEGGWRDRREGGWRDRREGRWREDGGRMEGGWREDGGGMEGGWREGEGRWREGEVEGWVRGVCGGTNLQHRCITCGSCSPDCKDDHQFAQVQNISENDLFVTSGEKKKPPITPHVFSLPSGRYTTSPNTQPANRITLSPSCYGN